MTATRRPTFTLVPLNKEAFEDRVIMSSRDEPGLTLGQLLQEHPAFSLEPLDKVTLDICVARLHLRTATPDPATPLYWPPGITVDGLTPPGVVPPEEPPAPEVSADEPAAVDETHPKELTERQAVLIAHDDEISGAAKYLESGLSVLIRCETLLVEHFASEMVRRAGLTPRILRLPEAGEADRSPLAGGRRQQLLAALQHAVREAKARDVVVVPHLDLLAGGSDANLTPEGRELTDVLYETRLPRAGEKHERILLAFTDPSLAIPEVLASRFAVRLAIEILPRAVRARSGKPVPIGTALVTQAEADLFQSYNAIEVYKHIAGMNAVRLRHAMQFAYDQHQHLLEQGGARFTDLVNELRTFKAKTSAAFEVPQVKFEDIGGYRSVKHELHRALRILAGADNLPEQLRHELIPRGFIFYGPPGTGKTLFAKAIANALDANILVVSGPEITDMYVGESERKLREIFTAARRNAPAVIVFDEFDSIASKRSGRDDGGNRANNAMVAQMLTEMDGFRPEVPVLVIGTTNRIDLIDEALLRPSRFKPIQIDLPNDEARLEIACVHADHFGVAVSPELLARIALATDKMNGDEIRSIFRDARANELVGDPPAPADARQLGRLVGALRRATQERDVDRQQQNPNRPAAQVRPAGILAPLPGGGSGAGPSDPSAPHTEVIVEGQE